jgi:hypothetical protein
MAEFFLTISGFIIKGGLSSITGIVDLISTIPLLYNSGYGGEDGGRGQALHPDCWAGSDLEFNHSNGLYPLPFAVAPSS